MIFQRKMDKFGFSVGSWQLAGIKLSQVAREFSNLKMGMANFGLAKFGAPSQTIAFQNFCR